MDNFIFDNHTKIIFGKDMESKVGKEISRYGKKVLLHYGGGSIKRSGLYDKVVNSLQEVGVEFIELGGVQPNPRLSLVYEGIKLCKKHGIDAILAVGGGSTIDSSKAIGLGVKYDGDVWDLYEDETRIQDCLPIATILTISAAGSESSNSSVITNDTLGIKRSSHSSAIYPVFSIINPELCYTLPKYQIACGSADIFAHLAERYFTNTQGVEFTDRLIEATMKTILHNSPKLVEGNADYDTWAQVVWAGTIAHNNLLNTGRVGDWASHNIEHELSAMYDIAHGAGLAIVFPAWMKYVYRHDLDRFVQFAVRVFHVEENYFDKEETALKGIAAFTNFLKSLGLSTTLTETGLPCDKFQEMAAQAAKIGGGTQGHFVELTPEDIVNIYNLAK